MVYFASKVSLRAYFRDLIARSCILFRSTVDCITDKQIPAIQAKGVKYGIQKLTRFPLKWLVYVVFSFPRSFSHEEQIRWNLAISNEANMLRITVERAQLAVLVTDLIPKFWGGNYVGGIQFSLSPGVGKHGLCRS